MRLQPHRGGRNLPSLTKIHILGDETINKFIKNFNRTKRNKEKKDRKQKINFWKSKKKGTNTGTANKPTVTTTPSKASQVAGTKTYTTYTPCHRGNVALTKLGEATLYAGGWTRGAKSAGCVTIDLTGTEYRWNTNVCAENLAAEFAFRRTLDSVQSPENTQQEKALAWLSMPISDYGTPKWELKTWLALAADIYDMMKDGKDVLIACTGGHGRTGLAISILLDILAVVPKGENPVEYVRKNYCEDAVETASQENYVYTTLGLPYKANVVDYAKNYGAYNRSYWYGDDDYYSSGKSAYNSKDSRLSFGLCAQCNESKWLYDGMCDKCQAYLEKLDEQADKILDGIVDEIIVGTCVYCGKGDLECIIHAGDLICNDCLDWLINVRQPEIDRINKAGSTLCDYCGDNIEKPMLYYNDDVICDRCYIDLYGAGLASEVIDSADGRRIVLRDRKNENMETK